MEAATGGALDAGSATSGLDLDLISASIRADSSDADSFFQVLASKLSDALAGRVEVQRERGLFKKDKPASGITIDLSAAAGVVLGATRQAHGITCTVSRPVRGIVVSSKQVPMAEWIDTLVQGLALEAQANSETWNALHGLLS